MSYAAERALARQAAVAAGRLIRRIYDAQDFTSVEKAGGKGPLTEADLAANDALIAMIRAAFPSDAILSEETKDTPARLTNARCWIIDPLDGTKEFTEGVPEFCVSVGFVVDGAPVVGALYNPVTEQLIDAEVGVGCALDGAPVTVSEHATLEGSRLLVSATEFKKGWFDAYVDRVDLRPVGSVAWKFGLVAIGQAEGTFTPKPRNEWDLCGGVACVLAAGGAAVDGQGKPYVFNCADPLKIGVCGTNGRVHDHVVALMQSVG